jgi:hypothetical protein
MHRLMIRTSLLRAHDGRRAACAGAVHSYAIHLSPQHIHLFVPADSDKMLSLRFFCVLFATNWRFWGSPPREVLTSPTRGKGFGTEVLFPPLPCPAPPMGDKASGQERPSGPSSDCWETADDTALTSVRPEMLSAVDGMPRSLMLPI